MSSLVQANFIFSKIVRLLYHYVENGLIPVLPVALADWTLRALVCETCGEQKPMGSVAELPPPTCSAADSLQLADPPPPPLGRRTC